MHARAAVIEQFWVPGTQPDQYARISAVLLHDGVRGRIWVDVRDTARLSSQAMTSIATALDVATPAGSRDPSRGIIENIQTVFGPSPERFKRGGKDDFLLTDLRNRAQGVTMLGTFMTKDQHPVAEQPYSNERNILYIDSREGMEDLPALLATAAHEYQHLVHFGMNPEAEQLFNEGCSELASQLVGYSDANGDYLANTNVPLMRWGGHHSAGLDADYQRGMSLMVYLHEQFGDRCIREFVASTASGVERIGQAVDRAGISSTRYSWRSVLRDFALANYLQTDGTGACGYRQRLDPSRSVHEASMVIGSPHGISSTPEVQLEPFGSSFHLYDRPGALRLRIEPNMGYQAVAILYYGGRPRIVELTPGLEQRIGGDGVAPDRVVLAFISLTAQPVAVRWRVRGDQGSTASVMADASDQVFSAIQIGDGRLMLPAWSMSGLPTAVGNPVTNRVWSTRSWLPKAFEIVGSLPEARRQAYFDRNAVSFRDPGWLIQSRTLTANGADHFLRFVQSSRQEIRRFENDKWIVSWMGPAIRSSD